VEGLQIMDILHYVPSFTSLQNTYMVALFGNFGFKEVGLGGQIGSSQNGSPTWTPSFNTFFEYKWKSKIRLY